MAITISFPKLNEALRKDKKNVKLFYEKGIVILNGIAFAISPTLILAVNLKEFFMIEHHIESSEELNELDIVLFYLEQKVFSPEYWKELIALSDMSVDKGKLVVDNPKYTKVLEYDIEQNNFRVLIDILLDFNSYQNVDEQVSLKMADILSINKCYSKEFKSDIISFQAIENNYVRFTFKDRKYFYGFINNRTDVTNDPFRFDTLREDLATLSDLKQFYKKGPEPPKPE
jgi:hypothetical protein